MKKPKHHLFVCCSFRPRGEAKGTCNRKGAIDLVQYVETELADRGMNEVAVSSTGCLKCCDQGPVIVIYPDGYWYGGIDEGAIDEILDALESDSQAEQYLIPE